MNQLKVIGREHIGHIEFTGIEGGFGENKKAMLVKDVAGIHNRPVFKINELINRNRKRFKDGIDIIDLASPDFAIFLKDSGFTQNQINASSNIYLLSERGYSKLLKILEDDKAWEVYDQLVDNYFNQRQAIRENQPSILEGKHLELMEDRAKTARGNLLYRLAMATGSDSAREQILADAVEAVTGQRRIPTMKQAEYTATEVAEKLGISSSKMVGIICNSLGLKAEKPLQNEFGRWAADKSQHGPKEVATWVYFDKGVAAIKAEAIKLGKITRED
ncbi:ORF6N domain-containing protein [Lacticaseibacillus sp. N501-2]|uniref:ORF6N domain-containing protein n=1 Tax=Lacticaseibacillus salsurae TaxID=3367729 RepID=UPI0038B2F9F6